MPASTCCSAAVRGQRMRHEGKVEPESQSPGDRHGGRRNPRGRRTRPGGRSAARRAGTQPGADPTARPSSGTAQGRWRRRRPPRCVRPSSPTYPPRITPASNATRSPGSTAASRLARRHGCWRDVIHATSCVAGVVTPADAIASMNTPVSCRSVTPGASAASASPSAALGDADRCTDGVDLLGRLDAADPAQQRLTVDELGRREGLRQELRRGRGQGVGGNGPSGRGTFDPLQRLHEARRIERDPVEVLVGDVVGDALVPRAEQMDGPGRPHEHAPGTEGSRAGGPQPRRSRHVAGVRFAPDDEHVDVGLLHLGEHTRPAGESQGRVIGTNLGDRHQTLRRDRRGSRSWAPTRPR